MVRLRGESSNSLFDTLMEWEAHLKAAGFPDTATQDNDPEECGDEHFGT
ncbi:MAG: hypothetical protein AAFY81_09400 [Pseudomonadota bacterium]